MLYARCIKFKIHIHIFWKTLVPSDSVLLQVQQLQQLRSLQIFRQNNVHIKSYIHQYHQHHNHLTIIIIVMLIRTKCVSCNVEDTQTTPVEVELKCEIVYKGLLRKTVKECNTFTIL